LSEDLTVTLRGVHGSHYLIFYRCKM